MSNLSERVIKEAITILRVCWQNKHRSWDSRLPEVEKVINGNLHESIGMPPYRVQFGRHMKPLLQPFINYPPNTIIQDETTLNKEIMNNLKRTYLVRKRRHHQNHKVIRLKIGELVLVRNTPRSDHRKGIMRKLSVLFIGPYRIKKRVGPNAYSLELLTGQYLGTFNLRRLKRFIGE
jgi:hypothetical protein